ncbi:MAG TPA: DUF3866 family protein [Gaiellaceae bacterium]|nr:DUF3866 family protein [Gaiellaceae bacterium]
MPLSLRRGRVSAIRERHDALVRLEVDGAACVAYPTVTGPVALDDEVLVNVQARDLELGSGGFDVLYANLTRGLGLAAEEGAHVMVLPYTPLQHARLHVEEAAEAGGSLDGMPVVCCSLHSQLAPVCAALAGLRVAYVQPAGGALPVSLSDTVRALRERGLVTATAAVAPCFDGDVQCVSLASALLWARGGHDVAVCAIGPGIVGTGTRFGHGGLAAAEAANAALALGGVPVVAERVSGADERARHRGRSHHTAAVLGLVRGDAVVADGGGDGWREACEGLPLSHMGRGPDDDPEFFAAAFAAGAAARRLLG